MKTLLLALALASTANTAREHGIKSDVDGLDGLIENVYLSPLVDNERE
jgi:hypothetical protein